MLHLTNLEEIEALLLRVPGLSDRLERRDIDYVPAVKEWLATAEACLINNRLPVAAQVAASRGALISVERGDGEADASRGRMSVRKWRDAQASRTVRQVTELIADVIRQRRADVDEADRIMNQLVAAADRLGILPVAGRGSHTAYLRSTMEVLSERSELAGMVVRVVGLLGTSDSLVVLDRAISSMGR